MIEIVSKYPITDYRTPIILRNAIIAPIYKKGSRKECGNYRGISLLSVVGKLYSSILVDRVRGKVENILGEFQGGFRPLRGCQNQIFRIRQTIEKLFEKNRDLFLCFIDLEKVFDISVVVV